MVQIDMLPGVTFFNWIGLLFPSSGISIIMNVFCPRQKWSVLGITVTGWKMSEKLQSDVIYYIKNQGLFLQSQPLYPSQ